MECVKRRAKDASNKSIPAARSKGRLGTVGPYSIIALHEIQAA